MMVYRFYLPRDKEKYESRKKLLLDSYGKVVEIKEKLQNEVQDAYVMLTAEDYAIHEDPRILV